MAYAHFKRQVELIHRGELESAIDCVLGFARRVVRELRDQEAEV